MTEIRAKGVWGAAISLVVFGGLFAGLFAISDTPQVALIILPFVAAAVRLPMTRVRLEGDRLRVRNFWRSYEVDRADITGFLVGDDMDYWNSRRRTVYVSRRGGCPRRLSATTGVYRKLLGFLPTPGKRNRADDLCDQLNAWLRTGA